MHQSQGNASLNRSIINTLFLPCNMFLPKEASHIFMTVLRLYSPPFTPRSLFDVLHNPAFGISVFGGKEMRRNDSFISPGRGIQIPADPLIAWLILHIVPGAGARLRLLGLLGEAWSSSLLLRLRMTAKRKQSLRSENAHAAPSYSHVTADK